jgi:NAD-dependent SIR2 family protein deacetylase
MSRVVAWHLRADVARCDQCGKPAMVDAVEDDQITVISLCNDCLPVGTPDPILDTCVRAVEAQQGKELPQRDA